MNHQKSISQFTKTELLEKLDDFEHWTGKDAVIAAVRNATSDAHAQALYRIGIYGPFGKPIYEVK